MFGSRGKYLQFFELSIPDHLYYDWHKCFVFHKLALSAIKDGKGSPVWLEDGRVVVVVPSSVDKTTVDMDKGEMGFELFAYDDSQIATILNSNATSFDKIQQLSTQLGEAKLPAYLITYIRNFSPKGTDSLAIHPPRDISGFQDVKGADHERIQRRKSFIGKSDLEHQKYPHAIHHVKIYYNSRGQARVFYKYVGNIKFLKNLKRLAHD